MLCMQHYEGVKYGFVSPYDLADSDVVLVSYETLSLELNYAKSHECKHSVCDVMCSLSVSQSPEC